ncbi:Protein GVP36 [Wickerhamiella sorbophila]|uniref:Protein GVP36 n=1 Tax=Wickerhamiella sorbophila TaxID=45607 RepID=A0A2T0FGY5_9ASCO|nr:Protein GVP36 [Wickerhamiella sorbophila]PRT54252.1 Protein GVP36 [Wickerhamiella sorbophila]
MGFDFNKGLASLQTSMSDLGSTIQPFAMRTRQMLNEKLGNADEVTALPEEYLELERRVDSLKSVVQKVSTVTGVYEHDGYDYPPNFKESLTDLSRTVQTRVSEAANAQSASDLGTILSGGRDSKKPPKTLNHAIARSFASAKADLADSVATPLASALTSLSETEQTIGVAHVEQDSQISQVHASLQTVVDTSLTFAAKARKNVHQARLSLDAAKSALKTAAAEQVADRQTDVEKAEDEFVAAIEDAVTVMKNVLETPEVVRALAQFAEAQLAFHKQAVEQLESVVPELDKFRDEQEASYRESRQ